MKYHLKNGDGVTCTSRRTAFTRIALTREAFGKIERPHCCKRCLAVFDAMREREAPAPVWQGVGTIGELEQLAGIEDRAAFWRPFAKIADSRESIDAGVRVLRKIAEERAAAKR